MPEKSKQEYEVGDLFVTETALTLKLMPSRKSGTVPIRWFAKDADVQDAVKAGVKAFGKLDVLYNNAGIFPAKDHSVVDTDEAIWDQVLSVNVKGVYLVCKHGIPELLAAGGGSVINVASFVAL